jgi:hypothetical protein
MIPTARARLLVNDVVTFADDFRHYWVGGRITGIGPDGISVCWPDRVTGLFEHRHAHRLERVA